MKKTNSLPSFKGASGSTNDIRGIKAPVHIPAAWRWLWWALGVLALAVVAALLWRWRRTAPKKTTPAVVIPPHRRALDKLRAALELMNQPKPFIIAVSDTVRVYLEERFDFRAPERTTEEFLLELQASSWLTERQMESLAEFLQRCDLVKFARYEPRNPELQDIYDAAVRLVEETSPPPAPVGVEETARA